MDSSFDAERPDDDLSTALGTETLAGRDMVPEEFQDRPNSMTVEVINRARYMKVDQSANLRAGSVSSKIWLHGDEYRSLEDSFEPREVRDEFYSYGRATPIEISTLRAFNPIELWKDNHTVYGTLSCWALDTLSIPAMATECERAFSSAFSSAKKLITPERNALGDDTIEAS